MNTNIPLYRAKKIGSDEYAIGYYVQDTITEIFETLAHTYKIDKDTMSIHFPYMLDSQGTKIFASLSEDGKGGDLLEILDCEGSDYVAVYNKSMFSYGAKNVNPAEDEWYFETFYELDGCIKAIGIKQ